ncbi:MAG TPA: hypothetical protein QF650_06440 [Vicinamibacterales bacterium]|nr:hypothetical protein [Vicinamibacterales bacterium]HJO38230.1 hypothetical protein [Vicinamibacterales bacterium]
MNSRRAPGTGVASRRRYGLYGVLVVLFLAHNDLWYWRDARLVLGLPVGLLYHVVYCLVVAVVLAAAVYLGAPEPATPHRDHDDA